MTIVGVVGDVRQQSPASAPAPTIYMPLQQHPYHANEVQVVIRADVDPASLTRPLGDRTHALNPSMAIRFTTLDAMVADSIATPRFRTFLVAAFAILALLLAMTGIYGVVTYVSAQRTAEFGVRLALGANGAQVFRMVVGGALRLTALAALLGLVLSLAAGRLIEGLLFGLEPVDPITYAAGFAIVFTVAGIAAALPARRASRVDPALVLREG
jgi:ABC-type antimicrobial peptide transport system permease subunit